MSAPKVKIYRVPASHPCQAVIRAAELKGVEHTVVDLVPPMQAVVASAIFGERTVPAMRISGGPNGTEKVQTTLKCLRALESLVPEPTLYPADAALRERVLKAEQWGVGEFQDVARRIAWVALRRRPEALFSFDSNMPLPNFLLRPFVRPAIWIERRLNRASAGRVREDLERLPEQIDQIDSWIEQGLIGGATPNAADLAVLSSVWLLRSFSDLREMLDSRPAGRRTRELFGEAPGNVPAQSFPAAWLTAVNAAHGSYVPVED